MVSFILNEIFKIKTQFGLKFALQTVTENRMTLTKDFLQDIYTILLEMERKKLKIKWSIKKSVYYHYTNYLWDLCTDFSWWKEPVSEVFYERRIFWRPEV